MELTDYWPDKGPAQDAAAAIERYEPAYVDCRMEDGLPWLEVSAPEGMLMSPVLAIQIGAALERALKQPLRFVALHPQHVDFVLSKPNQMFLHLRVSDEHVHNYGEPLDSIARAWGLGALLPHTDRYGLASAYLVWLRQLWAGWHPPGAGDQVAGRHGDARSRGGR